MSFKELADDDRNPTVFRDIYKVLDSNETSVGDSYTSHTTGQIKEVRDIMWEHIKASRISTGQSYRPLTEVREEMTGVCDALYNNMSGINTPQDTAYFNNASIPVAISPYDATALLASGGLPEIIINKKSKGVLLNGYSFHSTDIFWTEDKIKAIKERAEELNLEAAISDALTEALVYGGAVVYPVFKKDTARSFGETLDELKKQKILEKGCIARFTGTDRWNLVVVPDFIVTTEDYLFAKSFYIPMTGCKIRTERAAVLKPKKLPYWGAIQQLGWGISDFEGYMRAIMGYEIMMASIPMMAQQMSLIVRKLPLDGLIAMNGSDAFKDLIDKTEDEMRAWSVAQPKILNDIGSIEVVNRTYTGYADLGLMMRQNIAAQSGIPESVLFHTQPKGFNNNTEEVLLKQSETIKMAQKAVLPNLDKLKDILVIDVYGADSEEAKHTGKLRFTFDNPVIATESERAESAARFSAMVNSARQAGVPIDQAIKLSKQFFKSLEITDDLYNACADVANRVKERDELEIELLEKQLKEQAREEPVEQRKNKWGRR